MEFTDGEMPPARPCTLLEQGHQGASGLPPRSVLSVSILQNNTRLLEPPIDHNQLLHF